MQLKVVVGFSLFFVFSPPFFFVHLSLALLFVSAGRPSLVVLEWVVLWVASDSNADAEKVKLEQRVWGG